MYEIDNPCIFVQLSERKTVVMGEWVKHNSAVIDLIQSGLSHGSKLPCDMPNRHISD